MFNKTEVLDALHNIKKWLAKPFVFEEGKWFQFSLCSIIGLIVFVIIYALKPFGIENLDNNLLPYCAGYGFITFGVLFLYFFVLTPLFPKVFCDASWTVGKEIATIIGVTFVIGVVSWYYNSLVQLGGKNPDNFTLSSFLKYAFIIGIFPVIIYVFITEWFLNHKRKELSSHIMQEKSKKENVVKVNKDIVIYAENEKDAVSFNLKDLVYVTSEGNYVSFFIKNNGVLNEEVLRNKLNIVEKSLKAHKEIIRCHKSYIVNTSLVTELSGNARAFFLHFNELDNEIPVSRKFSRKELEKLLNI